MVENHLKHKKNRTYLKKKKKRPRSQNTWERNKNR